MRRTLAARSALVVAVLALALVAAACAGGAA
ncbi:MAG: hypothetical protein QOF11_376, partial [Chloroflexota bacterium]|nr:hypothetical protein [Chloroflexota bacterium]